MQQYILIGIIVVIAILSIVIAKRLYLKKLERFERLAREEKETFYTKTLNTHKDFFDHCLKYPLLDSYRRTMRNTQRTYILSI